MSVFVPKLVRAVRTARAESAVDGVEGDVVDSVDVGDIAVVWRIAVAFKCEVSAGWANQIKYECQERRGKRGAYEASLSSMYWKPQRPSILPIAKPEESRKQDTTLVCHFSGLCIVL